MDTRMSHCLACMGGGDAITTHNMLRDHVFYFALSARLHPQNEQFELLPDDPQRRPGDLYFATWTGGNRVAMDFAVTSPLQFQVLAESSRTRLVAANLYEIRKFEDRNTASRCTELGITLIPMIAESFGAWGDHAQKAFSTICNAYVAKNCVSESVAINQVYEGLNTKFMRLNARSLLVRICDINTSSRSQIQNRAKQLLTTTSRD